MLRFIADAGVARAAGGPTAAEPRQNEHKAAAVSVAGNPAAALAQARNHIAAFAAPQDARGASLVGLTVLLWVAAFTTGHFLFKTLPLDAWWGLAVAAAWIVARVGTHVRCFCVMHDAVHYSLFSRRWPNEAAAIVSGLLILVDAVDFRRTHAQHHESLGMLDETNKDPDLMLLWTKQEWDAWPWGIKKAVCRVLRDPLVFFTIVPQVYVLLLNAAWPHRVRNTTLKARMVYAAGRAVSVAALILLQAWITGVRAHIVAELIVGGLAMVHAMFLFSVEHIFEGVYMVQRAEHNRTAAALEGSSHLRAPWWWRWVLVGVETHHIHHVNARVPGYRMQECADSAPPGLWEELGVVELGARECAHAMLLTMWDADAQRYVPFPEWAWLERMLRPAVKKPGKAD